MNFSDGSRHGTCRGLKLRGVIAKQLDFDGLRHCGEITNEIFHQLCGFNLQAGNLRADLLADICHDSVNGPPVAALEANEVITLIGFGQAAAQLQAGSARIAGNVRSFADDGFNLTQQAIGVCQRGTGLGFVVKNEAAFIHFWHETGRHLIPRKAANQTQNYDAGVNKERGLLQDNLDAGAVMSRQPLQPTAGTLCLCCIPWTQPIGAQ